MTKRIIEDRRCTRYIRTDFGLLGEREVEVKFYYQKEEKQTWEEPGSPEEFEISEVSIGGIDISELLTQKECEELEELIRDNEEDDY